MPRQVSDEEYAFLQQKRQVADFVESIYNDPQLSREAKALIKKKYPNLSIPDYDIESRVESRLDEDRREREEEKRKASEADEDEKFRRLRKKTQDDYGFTDEAMADLEKLMVERNIGDYEIAANYMASRNPPTADGSYDPGYWHHNKTPGWEDIAKDPEAWGRTEIMKALRTDEQRNKGRY